MKKTAAQNRKITIEDYLAALSSDKRTALERIRKAIRAVLPDGEECISYGIPAVRFKGKVVAGFGATATHCAFYPFSSSTIAALQDDLREYDTSKGAIRFPPERPLSAVLVRKLVKTRIAETGR